MTKSVHMAEKETIVCLVAECVSKWPPKYNHRLPRLIPAEQPKGLPRSGKLVANLWSKHVLWTKSVIEIVELFCRPDHSFSMSHTRSSVACYDQTRKALP